MEIARGALSVNAEMAGRPPEGGTKVPRYSWSDYCGEIGMWEKGEAIGEYRGVNSLISFYELEKATGRDHHSLRHWHDLYKKAPGCH